MAIMKRMGDFFALDIGTNAVRVVQLSGNSKGWTLQHFGYAPADAKITTSDSAESKRRLGEVIMTAVGQSGVKTKNVVIGLPSSKTFTTVIDLPMSSEKELANTLKYKADQYIPMSAEDAKIDWALLGPSLHAQNQQEVLISSTANTYAEERLELVEGLGFNVIAAEPDPIAMVRAILPNGMKDACLIIDMGEQSTDLAIAYNDAPRLVRTIPTGISSLVKSAVQNLNVQEDQARQFIMKFGLAPDRLEGQVLHALENILENFSSEIVKSIKFFQTRYPNVQVSQGYIAGFGAAIPQFSEYLAEKSSVRMTPANPWQKVNVGASDQQALATIAAEFSTAIGLAQRGGN